MNSQEDITQGLGRKLNADELRFVHNEVAETIASGLDAAMAETGDMGDALDCLIISARAYLSQVEGLKEIYKNGLN